MLKIFANKKLGTDKDLATIIKYSTDEIKTDDLWVDSKPIYRKVISVGNLSAGSNNAITHGITDMETLLPLRGGFKMPGGYFEPIPKINTNSSYLATYSVVAVDVTATQFNITVGSGTTVQNCFMIFEYTKTSD